jgi:nucleobase:cation symporter-1, NCS1 family
VPLFGVLAADYFVLRRLPYSEAELYGAAAAGDAAPQAGPSLSALNPAGIIAWVAGILAYQLVARAVPWLGASIPSFVVSFAAYAVLTVAGRALRRSPAARSG